MTKNIIKIECEKIDKQKIKYTTQVDGQFNYDDLMRFSMNLSLISCTIMDTLLTQMVKDKPNDSTIKRRYDSNKNHMEKVEKILKLDSTLDKLFLASEVKDVKE